MPQAPGVTTHTHTYTHAFYSNCKNVIHIYTLSSPELLITLSDYILARRVQAVLLYINKSKCCAVISLYI